MVPAGISSGLVFGTEILRIRPIRMQPILALANHYHGGIVMCIRTPGKLRTRHGARMFGTARRMSGLSSERLQPIEHYVDIVAKEMIKPSVKRVLFVTGAGLSADSGLPTYRGGTTEDGIHIESAISGEMFKHHPEVCWKYLGQIEEACRHAEPNAGHKAIKDLEQAFEVWVLTQNVDGFHKKAGSKNLIDIHGDVHMIECTYCSYFERVEDYAGLEYSKTGEAPSKTPKCPECARVLRPAVTLFGEDLDLRKFRTLELNLFTWGFDVVFSVGTTSEFPYIALPVQVARDNKAFSVEVNLGATTPVSDIVSLRVPGPHGAADFLDRVARRVLRDRAA